MSRIRFPCSDEEPQRLIEAEDLAVDLFGERQRLVGQGRVDAGADFRPLRTDGARRADPGQRDQAGSRRDRFPAAAKKCLSGFMLQAKNRGWMNDEFAEARTRF